MIKKIDANKYGVVRYAISSIEDIADLPREVSVGSEAILVNEDGEKKFRLGSDGWVEVVEVKEYDEDKLRDMLEDAKVGYGGIEYETLEERLDKDFDNVYSVLDNRTYVEYEGCRITAKDSLNGLQKETVVKGRTLQNLVDRYDYSRHQYNGSCYHKEGFIKPNTTYTSVIYNYSSESLQIYINEKSFNYTLMTVEPNRYRVDKFQSKSTLDTGSILFKNGIRHELGLNYKVLFLEGDYTQTPLEELPLIEGIESVGDKSKNLFDGEWEVGGLAWDNGENKDAELDRIRTGFISVEENKKYKANQSFTHIFFFNKNKSLLSYKTTITSIETPNECKYIRLLKMNTTKILYDFQVEEGEIPTSYEPYYDGYKISGKSCGKNLWKPVLYGKVNAECEIQKDKVIVMGKEDTNWNNVRLKVKVKRNTDYFLSFNCDNPNGYISCRRIEGLTLIKDFGRSSARFNSGENEDILFLMHSSLDKAGIHVVEYSNIQLEEATTPTPYEPYRESTYSYILDEPLRSLPDGVCDTIDLATGVLTRRVGKVVITEDTPFALNNTGTNFTQFTTYGGTFKAEPTKTSNVWCDTKPIVALDESNNGFWIYRGSMGVFQMTESINTKELMKEWLRNNPTTVYYELANPITEYLIKDDKFVTLPNGVKDEVGRIVTRNVGKVVLNGSEEWVISTIKNENHIKYYTYVRDENGKQLKVEGSPIISPTFPIVGCMNSGDFEKYQQDIEGLYSDTSIAISVAKNRLETEDTEGLKKWLSQNPITVYYELETPYIECSYEKYPTLPNGVKDEVAYNSVLRRVGKFVVDGSQVLTRSSTNSNKTKTTHFGVNGVSSNSPYGICDKLPTVIDVTLQVYEEPCMKFSSPDRINPPYALWLNIDRSNADTVEEAYEYFRNNPHTVWYELRTPYVEPINLDEVILDTTRLKSYEPITHITSDNYLLPTIKTQVPSDFNAVVLGLKNNNEALTSQVMSLRQTNDELETTNREQDDVIDVTLLALDEVYGMIDEGEIEAMSMGSPMVNVYVKMIKRGIKTLDEVPTKYRAEVEKLI